MAKKYTPTELDANERARLHRRSGDLTSYAALVGEGFASRINLLAQLIRDAHHPSLGLYRERLLLQTIRDFLPRKFDVGTGFVVFPCERQFDRKVPEAYDVLNASDHTVSRQCDLIVYDCSEYPLILRDGDFVVVRPEAVRAVIEVKGSLSMADIDSSMEHFIDFGRKWQECRSFYKQKHQETKLPSPGLYLMGWQIAIDRRGRLKADAGRVRERIVKHYRTVDYQELRQFPILNSAYIYSDSETSSTYRMDNKTTRFGFHTRGGRFVRFDETGEPQSIGDSTVAALLGNIHNHLQTPFNRFFSYASQTAHDDLHAHPYAGFTEWLSKKDIGRLG